MLIYNAEEALIRSNYLKLVEEATLNLNLFQTKNIPNLDKIIFETSYMKQTKIEAITRLLIQIYCN